MNSKSAKAILIEEAARLQVAAYLSHRDFLRDLYQATKYRLDSYSYLKFAEDLGFSKTNVVRLVVVGERPLSVKAGEKMAASLGLKGPMRKYWLTLIKYSQARLPAERDQLFTQLISNKVKVAPKELGARQAEYFGAWYHPIIREMAGLGDFDGDPNWIKKRLAFPIRVDEIKRSLDLLVKIGALKYNKVKNKYSRSDERIATDTDADDMGLVRFHQQMISAGRESITRVHEDDREIRAITATLPKDKIPLVKAKILEFMTEVLAMEEDAAKQSEEEVYQMNIQLFPFTKK